MTTKRNDTVSKNYPADSRVAPTPAGMATIPQDWTVRTISEIADVKTGPFGSSLHQRDYVDEGIPIITVEHLGERGVIHEGLPLVSESDHSRLASYRLKRGDIVFSRVGSVDRNSLISEKEDGWLFSGRLLRVRVTDRNSCPAYLSYHFNSEPFKRRVRDVAVGQTMASLNTQILNSVSVVLPPLREQRAIAAALSDVDQLIGQLDVLIAKKQDIKLGALQQLLSGKTRLPGYKSKWEVVHLREVVSCQQGGTPPKNRAEYWNGDIPFVTGADLTTFDVGKGNARAFLTRAGLNSGATVICRPGTLLLATRTRVGLVGVVRETMGASQDNTLLTPSESVDASYLLWSLVARAGDLQRASRGTTIQGVSRGEVESLAMDLPPLSEQQSIARVLSDMDNELAALEHRSDKIRAIKQGIIQELLTGRTRLI